MTPRLAGIGTDIVAVALSQALVGSGATQRGPDAVEIAFVANAQAGTVALAHAAARAVVGTIDVNPARVKAVRPGSPNYAQDAESLPTDGHCTSLAPTSATSRRSISPAAACCGPGR